MKILRLLALVVGIAFVLLLIVGFDNGFAQLRSRMALFLVIAPIFLLFIWLVYKASQPVNRLRERGRRDKD